MHKNETSSEAHSGVPTVAELVANGLARAVQWNKAGTPTRYQISAAGQKLIYDALQLEAERRRA